MGFLSSVFGMFGFGIGVCIGLLVGFILFIYREPSEVQDPIIRPLYELDTRALENILPEIPVWMKNPDYDRVDWLNKFISQMWPYLDKAVCQMIRNMTQPLFKQYIGTFHIESIEFENLTLGTLSPTICGILPPPICGIKVYETNEKELVLEPALRWAGNPNIVVVLKLFSIRLPIQLVDLQIFLVPRITLKPLVPTFPCFASIMVSLMEKPHVDFGMKISGGDVMSIPGLYQFVQDKIIRQIANLYLWPQNLEIPMLDASMVAVKKPVGILHVKVVRAAKLSKKDILGTSDPYVKLGFSGERLPPKRTSVKMNNLNPVWNENFKLIVKDPQLQALELQVYDWDKVGGHDRIGMQLVPLKLLTPNETKEFTLDLVKDTNVNNPQNKKKRGQLVVELTYAHFKTDSDKSSDYGSGCEGKENGTKSAWDDEEFNRGGLLLLTILSAEDVESEHQNNPYALIQFRGEKRKTKSMKKTRDPVWNEEFQFMLEESPLDEKIRIEVLSKKRGLSLQPKASLGYIEINLSDVVHNGRINHQYHLINSKNGKIHLELNWKIA